jgi:hypothetical protein
MCFRSFRRFATKQGRYAPLSVKGLSFERKAFGSNWRCLLPRPKVDMGVGLADHRDKPQQAAVSTWFAGGCLRKRRRGVCDSGQLSGVCALSSAFSAGDFNFKIYLRERLAAF